MRGIFKSVFLFLLIAGLAFTLSLYVSASAKGTAQHPVAKTVVPSVNAWNPFPPPIEKPKDDDDGGIAGNAWNPFPPPIEKPKDDDDGGIAGNAWNPFPPPIEKPKPKKKNDDDGGIFIAGNAWNPFPPPIEKPKDDDDGGLK